MLRELGGRAVPAIELSLPQCIYITEASEVIIKINNDVRCIRKTHLDWNIEDS